MDLTWKSPTLLSYRSRHSADALATGAHRGEVFYSNRSRLRSTSFGARFCDGNQRVTARRRQRPAPPQHLAKLLPVPMSLGQLPRSHGSHQTVRTVLDRRI
jgi:hypothetical protein